MPQPQPKAQLLPGPQLELLADLRTIARYLDRIADTAPNGSPDHGAARMHATALRIAIDQVDELAQFVNDLAAVAASSVMGES